MDTSGGDSAQLPLKQRPGSTMDLHQMPPGQFYFTWRVEAEQVLSSRKAQPGLVKERGSPEREPRRMVSEDQPPFLCLVLQPCWTTAHDTLSQPLAAALLRLSGPLPAAWGVPAHPLTPNSSEKCSLHLLTPSIHSESSSCRLFEQGSPGACPLWTATPVDPCVFHLDWEPIDGPALHWRRTHKISVELKRI